MPNWATEIEPSLRTLLADAERQLEAVAAFEGSADAATASPERAALFDHLGAVATRAQEFARRALKGGRGTWPHLYTEAKDLRAELDVAGAGIEDPGVEK